MRAKILPAVIVLALLSIPLVSMAIPGRTSVLSDLRVDQPVDGDVVVFGADLELGPEAIIDGDAIAVGGDVRVASGAEVGRHVVAVFGEAATGPGAEVGGRVLSFVSLASLSPGSGGEPRPPRLDLAMRLLTSGGWLLVTTALAFLMPTRIRYGVWAVPALGARVVFLGVMVGLTLVAALVAVLGLNPALGVSMAMAVMVVFFAGKVVGLTVLGGWTGSAVLRRWVPHPLPITVEVFVGMLVLLALRFLPVVGGTLWIGVSLTALGTCVAVLTLETHVPQIGASHP
ncbi:MAG: hypothetical protein ACC742_10620 [Thermoanaerobaculales bacterium]